MENIQKLSTNAFGNKKAHNRTKKRAILNIVISKECLLMKVVKILSIVN